MRRWAACINCVDTDAAIIDVLLLAMQPIQYTVEV